MKNGVAFSWIKEVDGWFWICFAENCRVRVNLHGENCGVLQNIKIKVV